jgi:elongation factor 1-beta
MGNALIQFKIMPESLEVKLDNLRKIIQEKVEGVQGNIKNFEEQPIAFGLKALITTVKIDESIDTSKLEDVFKDIEGISSSDVIDYRRAVE